MRYFKSMKKALPILSQIQYFYKKLFKDILENTSNQSFGKTSQGKSMVESILVNYKLTNFYSFRYIYFEKNPRINTLLFIMSIIPTKMSMEIFINFQFYKKLTIPLITRFSSKIYIDC